MAGRQDALGWRVMSAGGMSLAEPSWRKASRLVSDGSSVRRSGKLHQPSLTEIMSLSDWPRFVPESLGLLVVISLVRMALPGGLAGLENIPHPFWIPVLLMSAQYGIMGALFATMAVTGVFFASELPPQYASQDFYAYAGMVAVQPCAWFAAALVLGGLRTLHIHHYGELQDRLDETRLSAEDLADGLEHAVSETRRLEQRIAGDSSTLASFLHSLAKLELRDRRSLVASIADVIRYGVGSTSFAIYLRGAHGMEPCLGVEDGVGVASTSIAPLPSCLTREVAGEAPGAASDAVTGLAPGRDSGLGALHWAPIRCSGSAETVGLVVCTRLQPSRDPVIAVRRLNEVCCVLAVLLSACPSTVTGTDQDGET
jgi:hypothetical protein